MREVFALKAGENYLLKYGTETGVNDNSEFFEFRNFIKGNGDDVCFIHSHPYSCCWLSLTDLKTFNGLRIGLGFDFDFVILDDKDVIFGEVFVNGSNEVEIKEHKSFWKRKLMMYKYRKIIKKVRDESRY